MTRRCDVRSRELKELKRLVGVLVETDRTVLYDRIKHLGKSYIARGYVTVEELEDLDLMHGVYHDKDKLGGQRFSRCPYEDSTCPGSQGNVKEKCI